MELFPSLDTVDGTVQDGDSVENEDAQDIEEDVVEREEEIVSEEADDDDKLDNDEGSLKEDEEEIEEDEVNLGRRIDIGDEVIAQSPEDGWFYRG